MHKHMYRIESISVLYRSNWAALNWIKERERLKEEKKTNMHTQTNKTKQIFVYSALWWCNRTLFFWRVIIISIIKQKQKKKDCQLTAELVKSMFVLTVLWWSGCSALTLLPREPFGVSASPCTNRRSAYNWNIVSNDLPKKKNKLRENQRTESARWKATSCTLLYLLTCDINWFVENDPRCCLPAARVSCRSLVRHVVVRLREKTVKWNVPQISRLSYSVVNSLLFVLFSVDN